MEKVVQKAGAGLRLFDSRKYDIMKHLNFLMEENAP